MSSAPCLAVQVLEGETFDALATEWEELLQRSYDNRIFFTPVWNKVWWKHFGSGEPRFVTVRDDSGALQALVPLRIQESSNNQTLTLIGRRNVADYLDALADKSRAQVLLEQALRQALNEIGPDRVEFDHVPSGSPLIPALQNAGGDVGFDVVVEDDEVCPVAILCANWDGYLQMLSKKQRHEIRRKMRRFQSEAEWSWRSTEQRDELDRDMDTFFRLHELSASEKARFMTREMREFFRDVASTFLDVGVLRLSVLTRDGVDVAATMSFLYRDRYLLYNSGFDPTYSAVSPGITAVALAMQDAIAQKAVVFDFLSGDEPYKYQFGAANTHTCRVIASR